MKKIDCKKSIVAALSLSFIGISGNVQSAGDGEFLGAMSYVAFNFAPRAYATCDGQYLAISEYTALFSLLGTTYGGDGRTNFALPDMRGRVPIHAGTGPGLQSYRMGKGSGTEITTLTTNNLPSHKHDVAVSATSTSILKGVNTGGNAPRPGSNAIAKSSTGDSDFSSTAPSADMNADSVATTTTTTVTEQNVGGGQYFSNMQPYTVLNCVIAVEGLFPSRQ